jgi:hypothetical protein
LQHTRRHFLARLIGVLLEELGERPVVNVVVVEVFISLLAADGFEAEPFELNK